MHYFFRKKNTCGREVFFTISFLKVSGRSERIRGKTNIRLDYGIGPDMSGFYITFGEAF